MNDSDIYRMTDAYRDRHPELDPPGPDEDSLRAYFADHLHEDWPDGFVARCLAGWSCLTVGAALAILALVWLVTT